MGQQGCILSAGSRGDWFPCFFQLPEAAHIPCLVTLHDSSLCFQATYSSLTLTLPVLRILIITLGLLGYSPHLKILNLLISVKFLLPCKVTNHRFHVLGSARPWGGVIILLSSRTPLFQKAEKVF